MKEILIVSGKGGTGKTSFSASFAQLSKNAVFCDCDVDAANLHLLLAPENRETHEFYAGWLPAADIEKCTACGICQKVCRFQAVNVRGGKLELLNASCEGCGVCSDHCPVGAITLKPRHCGRIYSAQTAYGRMYHAELFPGEENSGKLISELRKKARSAAEQQHAELLISDGPPGIGCPVISAMSGVDMVVAVTEPTPSGEHDLRRLMLLAHQFEVPAAVIINKCDLNGEISSSIADFCSKKGIRLLGMVPFDAIFTEMLKAGKTVLSAPDSVSAVKIKDIWQKLNKSLN